MKRFAEEEKRYSDEKKDIEKEAKKLEHERDVWQAKDPYFLFAEALLQIAIVMASVSILARSGAIFSFGLRAGRGGRPPHPQRILLLRPRPADARRPLRPRSTGRGPASASSMRHALRARGRAGKSSHADVSSARPGAQCVRHDEPPSLSGGSRRASAGCDRR